MSNTCGNCDCADKTNCPKKGNSYGVQIVDTEKSYYDVVAEVPAGENDGKCKCGPSCSCVNCTCGSH
ncbi:hypothetical protein AQUCO_00800273v1 [Aquilegia coerulea]|uniref:Metallothionein-like protein n=1 Tax=Aquilegia coerulea TaxID=218851 RepID=A0A2G5EI14_AQUCA|nr:hypothetical protein AQUCO_00800273v1 [Aquilegia coerulea]